jgi:proliferating cell nuclear antigen
MKLKLENPLSFVRAIELISELVLEVKIKVTEYGLSIVALDPANVAMVIFKFPKSSFLEFEADSENEILGVNLENLKKILKRANKSSSLIIEKDENKLKIQIEDKLKRIFNLNLIEVDSEDKDVPDLEYVANVELESQDFVEAIEDSSVVSDACSFIIKDGKFIIEARENGSARVEFSSDIAKIEAEDCSARYSLEYLQKFLKAAKISDLTRLHFSQDHPLKLDFRFNSISLEFILAPRMETED